MSNTIASDTLVEAVARGVAIVAAFAAAACAPEPVQHRCVELSTGKAVIAREAISRWETIYVYSDKNGLSQRITAKNSHLWQCATNNGKAE